MLTRKQWIRYGVSKALEWLGYTTIICLLMCFGAGVIATLAVGVIWIRSSSFPDSTWTIFGWSMAIGFGVGMFFRAYSAIDTLYNHRLVVGTVLWVEEGTDVNVTQEWTSTVRISACPELTIITPVAFPYEGTRGKTMIVWIPRGPAPDPTRVQPIHADLI